MIYLDNAATTRVRDEVIDIMVKYLKENYKNRPSNLTGGANLRARKNAKTLNLRLKPLPK